MSNKQEHKREEKKEEPVFHVKLEDELAERAPPHVSNRLTPLLMRFASTHPGVGKSKISKKLAKKQRKAQRKAWVKVATHPAPLKAMAKFADANNPYIFKPGVKTEPVQPRSLGAARRKEQQ